MSNYKEFKKELIDTKEEKKEEIKKLKKDLANFTSEHELPARTEEDLTETEKTTEVKPDTEIERIKKLKCDYKLFKDERTKNKMFVPGGCELCNKKFIDSDKIYVAITKQKNELFICENCAEK